MRRTRIALLISLAAVAVFAIGCARKSDDAQLATTIKAEMFSDPQTKDSGLQVAVKDSVVTLSGTVPSDAARYEAYKLATTTPGVTKVNDQTVVQASPAPPTQTAEATPPATAPEETPAPAPVATPERRSSRNARRDRAERTREANARRQRDAEARNTDTGSADARDAERHNQGQNQAQPSADAQRDAQQSAQPPVEAAPPVAAPAPPPPPQPLTATFSPGTTVEIRTVDPVDTSVNHVGDEFQATLAEPLTSAGVVVVPAGTNIYMRLTQAQTSGQYKGRNELQLQLVRLEFNGRQYTVGSDPYTEAGKSRGKNTAEKVGGGAALGAIIGAIAGGGKGAAIGAGVGGAGGGVYQGVSKVKPLRIPAETRLDFRLNQPLNVTYMPHHRDAQ